MGKFIDETGNIYGRLTVIERAGKDKNRQTIWRCICSCGNEKNVTGNNLHSGRSKSCGCQKDQVIDETGNRYGRLTVIKRAENDKRGRALWLCSCFCGNTAIVLGSSLRKGYTNSCGCLQIEIISQKVIPESEYEIRKKERNYRKTKEYKKMKAQIWQECGHICQICAKHLDKNAGQKANGGHVAHLASLKSLNYDMELYHRRENLTLLCPKCHHRLDDLKGEKPRRGPHKGAKDSVWWWERNENLDGSKCTKQ
jgi:5-methylcytosine-specific restriction endonuclease McrA